MSVADEFVRGINTVLVRLGSVMPLVTPQKVSRDVLAVFSSVGANDAAIVNSLGIEAKIIYCEVITPPPQKFDRFLFGARAFVIHDAHDLIVDGVIVAHKCAVKAV